MDLSRRVIWSLVVDHGLLSMAYIAELDPGTRQIRAAASWGNGLDYLQELALAVDSGPLSEGTVGVALRTGRRARAQSSPLRLQPSAIS